MKNLRSTDISVVEENEGVLRMFCRDNSDAHLETLKITSFDPLDEPVRCPSPMSIALKDAEVKRGSILYTRLTVISKCLPQCPRIALGLCLLVWQVRTLAVKKTTPSHTWF